MKVLFIPAGTPVRARQANADETVNWTAPVLVKTTIRDWVAEKYSYEPGAIGDSAARYAFYVFRLPKHTKENYLWVYVDAEHCKVIDV